MLKSLLLLLWLCLLLCLSHKYKLIIAIRVTHGMTLKYCNITASGIRSIVNCWFLLSRQWVDVVLFSKQWSDNSEYQGVICYLYMVNHFVTCAWSRASLLRRLLLCDAKDHLFIQCESCSIMVACYHFPEFLTKLFSIVVSFLQTHNRLTLHDDYSGCCECITR